MSKIVKVSNSNYKVSVQSGGTITLDTGNQTGTVYVSGDLIVQGNTTTVESETLTVTEGSLFYNLTLYFLPDFNYSVVIDS